MVIDRKVWRDGVARSLHELGWLEFQKQLWCNKIPDIFSSYNVLCELFSVLVNKDVVEQDTKNGVYSHELAEKLVPLVEDLDNFEYVVGTDSDYDLFWVHPQWLDLAERAKKIFNEEFRDDFIRLGKPYTEWLEKWPV